MIGVKIVQNIQTIYIRLKLDSPKILIMLANDILEKSQFITWQLETDNNNQNTPTHFEKLES